MPTSDSVTCYYSWNNSRFGREWTECIDKQWEGSRKPSGVRRQGASCLQPKYAGSNKYGGKSWLMHCANLTPRPKTSLTSCNPLRFSREVSSWLCQNLQKMRRSCLLSDMKIGPDRRNRLCVLSETLYIAVTFSDDLMDLLNLLCYPNSLNLINNTLLIQWLHSWWDPDILMGVYGGDHLVPIHCTMFVVVCCIELNISWSIQQGCCNPLCPASRSWFFLFLKTWSI